MQHTNTNAIVAKRVSAMTFSERRKFFALTRTQRMSAVDALSVVERDRNRMAVGANDVRDMAREQRNRRMVPSAHVYA